jgi:hypothetical protein
MELIVAPTGLVCCLYAEAIALGELGRASIERASHVEPTAAGAWMADLAPVGGPRLGPYPLRSAALAAEVEWLRSHWLPAAATQTVWLTADG